MATLILVRHGESQANVARIFAGHTDVDLSPKGYRQAELTTDYVLSRYAIDAIYTSDLMRAWHTVEPAGKKLDLPLRPDPRLREIYAGEWEGLPFDTLETKYAGDYACWRNNIGLAHPTGGETVEHLWHRFYDALAAIAAENPGKTVLIGTHATPIRTIQCRLSGNTPEDMKDTPWVSNASVTVIDFPEEGTPTLLSVGEDAHLAVLKTILPANV